MAIRKVVDYRPFRLWSLLAAIFAAFTMGITLVIAQGIAGSFVHVRDSDGTVPRAGATVTLTFAGGASGSVTLLATRPGEKVMDTGTYTIQGQRITIRFREVEWVADKQPFQFDGCTLILPFKALGATPGPGTSTWRRQDPGCGQRQPGSAAKPDKAHAEGTAAPPGQAKSQGGPSGKGQPPMLKFRPFSADEVITEGGQHRKVKVYATGKAFRIEGEENGQKSLTIMRFDRGVMWTLTPQTKVYTETSLNLGQGTTLLQEGSIEPGCSVVGEEKLGSYHCLKELCRITIAGKDYLKTQWAAKELGGLIIKYTDGVRTFAFENIKLAPQDLTLFEIPASYQKSR